MEKHPEQPKTRGRPRKDAPGRDDAGKGEIDAGADTGHGQIGDGGPGVRAKPVAEAPIIGYAQLEAYVLSRINHEHRASLVTHPDAKGLIQTQQWGNIRTEVGAPGYVLSTGERVDVLDSEIGPVEVTKK